MAKPRRPKLPTAWDWICRWGRSEGADPEVVSLVEATEHLLTRLEHACQRNLPLALPTLDLATLLITIQGKLAVQDAEPTWKAAQPLLALAYARDRAKVLAWMRENRGFTRPQPEPTPEPEEPSHVTLYDLVKEFRLLVERAHKSARKRSQSH